MSKAVDVALVLVDHGTRRPVIASLTSESTVGELAAALGYTEALYRHEQVLDPSLTLVDAGVMAGDALGVGAPIAVDWRQLRPELRVIGGVGAGLGRRLDGSGVVVGRGEDADVVVASPRLSRAHVAVRLEGDGFRVRDLDSRNGVFVDGVRLAAGANVDLTFGAVVRAGDTLFTVAAPSDGSTTLRRADPFHLAFAGGRGVRVGVRPAAPFVEPVHAPVGHRRSLLPFVVPSAGAAALAASASGVSPTLAFAATPVALAGALVIERVAHRQEVGRSAATRAAARDAHAREQRAALLAYAAQTRAAFPDPATLLAQVDQRGPRLWSMAVGDARVRLGLTQDGDAWVPVTVALSAKPLVLAGAEPHLDALTAWCVVQCAGLVPPKDLDVVVVSDRLDRWAWTALLPHRAPRTVLPATATPVDLPPRRGTRRLIVLDRPESSRWNGAPSLSADDYVVWRTAHEEDVPYNASAVVSAASPVRLRIEDAEGVRDDVVIDAVQDPVGFASSAALALARLQSPFGVAGAGGDVRLTEVAPGLVSVDEIVRAWRGAGGPLRAPLGVDERGVLELELDGQNSHALVAGTTGSGKTRLLETLILSLAASRSPADLNVLIIDFKGGNELAAVAALPHCVGLVSDREIAQVDRAITALTREIARRDELFASVGASDLADYMAKAGASLPRLVVIADEFGQFRRDDSLGGRVATLLRIASQGRSKGLHLLLATQSPSTDVTAEIRQNVGVRLCLRVAEAAESVAVLGVPDAARLPGPGHLLLAVDNELRTGRVALSNEPLEADGGVRVTELADAACGRFAPAPPATHRVIDLAIANLSAAAAAIGAAAPVLLAPPLATEVVRRELRHARRPWTNGGLVLGARDRPGIAEPAPFCFDLSRHAALTIVGGPRSGRTTALLALAEAAQDQADPACPVVVQPIAWSPGLESLDTDGSVVLRGDYDHLRRTIAWLASPVEDATRLVLIDRLDLLLRDIRELDGGGLASQLLEILNDGPRRNIAVAATLDPSAMVIGTPLAGPRLVLGIDDATVAVAAGIPGRPGVPAGRGVLANGGDDVQIGLPSGVLPRREAGAVTRMPPTVSLAAIAGSTDERVVIGVGGTARLAPMSIDLDAVGPVIVVIGRPGSGRSTALDAFAASYRGRRRVVACPDELPDEPSLVLVDDAVRAATTRPWLDAEDFPDRLRLGGHVAVLALEQSDLTALGYRHWLARRTYPGLLLSLDATPDRIVASERVGFLPPAELRAGPAGRGWWCWRGAGVPMQVAT